MFMWEDSFLKNLIYLTIFDDGAYMDSQIELPGRDEPVNTEELVRFYLKSGQIFFESRRKETEFPEIIWLERVIKEEGMIEEISAYLYMKNKAPNSRKVFLDRLMWKTRIQAALDGTYLRVTDENQLRNFFEALILAMRGILKVLRRNHHEKRKGVPEEYWELLTDQSRYLEKLEELILLGGGCDWRQERLHEYPVSVLKGKRLLFWILMEYMNTAENVSILEWKEHLSGDGWSRESARYLMRGLCRVDSLCHSRQICEYLKRYYEQEVRQIKIPEAGIWEAGSDRRHLWLLADAAQRFSIELSKEMAAYLLPFCPYSIDQKEEWLPLRFLSRSEVREEIQKNLNRGIVEDIFLYWHICYCVDDPEVDCVPFMRRLANNQLRKKWIRKAAIQYVCRHMPFEQIFKCVLPKMYGEAFFYVLEQYLDCERDKLIPVIWQYGEHYVTHKFRCDALLLRLQDPRGTDSLLNHMERRGVLPPGSEEYRVIESVGKIDCPELLEHTKRFFCLGLRDSFQSGAGSQLAEAAGSSLLRLAAHEERIAAEVGAFLKACAEKYREKPRQSSVIDKVTEAWKRQEQERI